MGLKVLSCDFLKETGCSLAKSNKYKAYRSTIFNDIYRLFFQTKTIYSWELNWRVFTWINQRSFLIGVCTYWTLFSNTTMRWTPHRFTISFTIDNSLSPLKEVNIQLCSQHFQICLFSFITSMRRCILWKEKFFCFFLSTHTIGRSHKRVWSQICARSYEGLTAPN